MNCDCMHDVDGPRNTPGMGVGGGGGDGRMEILREVSSSSPPSPLYSWSATLVLSTPPLSSIHEGNTEVENNCFTSSLNEISTGQVGKEWLGAL
jgi:hypothetical protein